MRASIDWPHCPTSTRSSMLPRRNGPKISSHGKGREPAAARNVDGIGDQEGSKELSGPPPCFIGCPVRCGAQLPSENTCFRSRLRHAMIFGSAVPANAGGEKGGHFWNKTSSGRIHVEAANSLPDTVRPRRHSAETSVC